MMNVSRPVEHPNVEVEESGPNDCNITVAISVSRFMEAVKGTLTGY